MWNEQKFLTEAGGSIQEHNKEIKEPISVFDPKDPWKSAFLHNIPPDILGLIKILMLAQNPIKDP